MTVAIGVAVSEALVLAADSRTTYGNFKGFPRIASDCTNKICRLTDRVGVATAGWAMLSSRTVHSLAVEFASTRNTSETIEDVLPEFLNYFEHLYDRHTQAGIDKPVDPGMCAIKFIIAGYDTQGVGRLKLCDIPGRRCIDICSTARPGPVWIGQTDVICRLVNGYDPSIDLSRLNESARNELQGSSLVIYWARMNPQDAVDFAHFAIRTTIEVQRFADGIVKDPGSFPGVGGAIDIAVIAPSGFTWLANKVLHGERRDRRALSTS